MKTTFNPRIKTLLRLKEKFMMNSEIGVLADNVKPFRENLVFISENEFDDFLINDRLGVIDNMIFIKNSIYSSKLGLVTSPDLVAKLMKGAK